MDTTILFLGLFITIILAAIYLRKWRYYPMGFANPRPCMSGGSLRA